jgi:hypothetical protein
VHGMDVSSHNRWLIFKREKGLFPTNRIVLCLLPPLSLALRQINIDYAVCQSLSSMADNPRVITIYDVACQWSRNFRRRVKDSNFLDIPPNLQMVPAVGKWHLGAHVADCFPKFSLNFIQGIGQVDGEVLETLWSVTNKVAGTTRAMGKSHRSEVLDDNMYDSNWKKWVGIGKATFPLLHLVIWTANSEPHNEQFQLWPTSTK